MTCSRVPVEHDNNKEQGNLEPKASSGLVALKNHEYNGVKELWCVQEDPHLVIRAECKGMEGSALF